ncbi:MAG TPA: flagellar motor switch protein FliN [Pirellulaceae bacterium]|jgi:flagellar motor switch protein FliN|nr:flagellar motor switch protein FliN [Pirellulaceae bacterium]
MADESQQPVPTEAAEPATDSGRGAVESLLEEAQSALASLDEAAAQLPPGVKPFELKDLFGAAPANEQASLDLLRDVQLDLKIELGRTQMHLEDVLRMKQGAVVTLDKLAGDPVDIYANGRLIARGEVLVLNDNFCVRVAELISSEAAA